MKNRDPKSQKPETSSDDDAEIGGNVSDSFIIHGDGNVINVDINGLSKPLTAPPLPSLIIGREEEIEVLKERLGAKGNVEQTTQVQILTAMRGWPGVGKSTLASAIAHDPEVLKKYSDGVLWASIGPDPNIMSVLTMWDRALGSNALEKDSINRTIDESSVLLAKLVQNKRILFVFDDVWDSKSIVPLLQIVGARSALLITTRSNEVSNTLAKPSDIFRLQVLTDKQGLELLNNFASTIVAQQPELCKKLVAEVEGLPLALHLLGRMLRQGVNPETLLGELRQGAALLAESPSNRRELFAETTPLYMR